MFNSDGFAISFSFCARDKRLMYFSSFIADDLVCSGILKTIFSGLKLLVYLLPVPLTCAKKRFARSLVYPV